MPDPPSPSDGRRAVLASLVENARGELREWATAQIAVALTVDHQLVQLAYASGEGAVELFELQRSLGEGPAITAAANGLPVIVDLMAPARPEWVVFTPEAQALGIGTICCLPLVAGEARVGALTAHRPPTRPRPLEAPAARRPPVVAERDLQRLYRLADRMLLAVLAPNGSPNPGPADEQSRFTPVIHQAVGMISVQLGAGIVDAVASLQAEAFASGRDLDAVARDVVTGRRRFGPPGQQRRVDTTERADDFPESTDSGNDESMGPADGNLSRASVC